MVNQKKQTSLLEVVRHIGKYDENHTIYVKDNKGWSISSATIVCESPDDSTKPIEKEQITYDFFLEIFIAAEFIENVKGNLEEKCKRLIYYAKHYA